MTTCAGIVADVASPKRGRGSGREVVPRWARSVSLRPMLIRTAGRFHRFLYRASAGRIGGKLGGGQILLLTTFGRRSGKRRTTPLAYLEDGDRLVLAAAFAGADVHPAWYLNFLARADVEVQIRGRRTRPMRGRPASPRERARLWRAFTALYPRAEDYQRRTTRVIPLLVLEPR